MGNCHFRLDRKTLSGGENGKAALHSRRVAASSTAAIAAEVAKVARVAVTSDERDKMAEDLAYFNVCIYRDAAPGELRQDDIECTAHAMRTLAASCVLALGTLLMSGAYAQEPSAERGRALYENHCTVCHNSKVHSRVNRLAMSRAEVRDIVDKWQMQEKLTWGTQEVEDVVEFLNRTRYRFP